MENQTPNPGPEPTETPAPPVPPPSKSIFKNKLFLGFVIVSILLAFLVGGYFLGQSSNKQSSPMVPTPTASPKTPVNLSEASFEEYCKITYCPEGIKTTILPSELKEAKYYDFSFNYPKDWVIAR